MKWNQIQSVVVCLSFIICLGFLGYNFNDAVGTNQDLVVGVYHTGVIVSGNDNATKTDQESGLSQEPEDLKPKIAITFDDGPHPVYTPLLLDGLKERNIKATFFLIGKNIEGNEELVKRMAEEGHLIGNHTYDHVQISSISNSAANDQLEKTNELIASIIGEGTQYIRPPFGAGNSKLNSSIPMITVMWTIDPLDWTTKNVREVVAKVVTKAKENDIILLHDCYPTSVEAALKIIDELQAKGFEFVTVDELILD